MRNIIIFILGAILFSSSCFAEIYVLDNSHTYIGFKVRHLGFAYVQGHFNTFEGQATYNEKSGKLEKINAKIQTKTIDTNESDRDKHLRSGDFFDVKKYPLITFVGTNVIYKSKKPHQIEGDLTIKGIEKKITLNINEWGGIAYDAWGNKRLAFEAIAKFDRRDFDLTWNKIIDKTKGLTVGNEVKLVLEIQGIKK